MRQEPIPHPIPTTLAELIAERFKVLADPTRIRLLDCLRDGAATAGELTARVAGTQQNVSKHLGVLLTAGLVTRRKQGAFASYEIADETVFAICEQVCGGLRRQLDELGQILEGAA